MVSNKKHILGKQIPNGMQQIPVFHCDITGWQDVLLVGWHGGLHPKPLVEMEKGETLFFHGRLIHGSIPNVSFDKFRKTFICHYIPKLLTDYNKGYDPQIELK